MRYFGPVVFALACSQPMYLRPPPPFDPPIRPELGGCTWAQRAYEQETTPVDDHARTTRSETTTWDPHGRPIRLVHDDQTSSRLGEATTHLVRTWTWRGECPVRIRDERLWTASWAPMVDSSTSVQETTCDDHDRPTETDTHTEHSYNTASGETTPLSPSDQTERWENAYDDRGDLVGVTLLDSSWPYRITYEWDRHHPVRMHWEAEPSPLFSIFGTPGDDGVWTGEWTGSWTDDGALLRTRQTDETRPEVRTRDLYSDDSWLGTDTWTDNPSDPDPVNPTRQRWLYSPGPGFPVGTITTDVDGVTVDEETIEVTCR